MKQIIRILIVFGSINLSAQNPYFQQEVNYQIKVKLDDQQHLLDGYITINYKNNSPDTLQRLYFHLWPNAYRNQTTAFAQQMLRQGRQDFYFAKDSQLGSISKIDFLVDDQEVRWRLSNEHQDIALLILNQPLAPNQSIKIETPFRVKIPDSFSRLGHVDDAYQITQWYPKPAVYDREGWHPMPYLDNGEFYSEFGSFDVQITLPDNYLVGATGELVSADEKERLEKISQETRLYLDTFPYPSPFIEFEPSPESSEKWKTIQFKAEDVHDFAWFADKRFKVLVDQLELATGQKIETKVFFTKSEEAYWQYAMDYMQRALVFFSEKVGAYPYPQMTVVQSALSAGGGMEYPMITVIDEVGTETYLDEVIAHEVGHNWFYGVLASNERAHAWLDEGITSYYEKKYLESIEDLEHETSRKKRLLEELGAPRRPYLYKARTRRDQAPDTPADQLRPSNYAMSSYTKPALGFRMLEEYMGCFEFDQAMQAYYQRWKFKHPQPEDLRAVLIQHNRDSLDWLFDGILGSTERYDYAIKRVKRINDSLQIIVKNKGKIAGPIAIGGIKNKEVDRLSWHAPTGKKTSIKIPDEGFHKIILDPLFLTPDLNGKNNSWDLMGPIPRLEPVEFPIMNIHEKAYKSNINWGPLYGWNAYDQSMFGAAFYNTVFPHRPFEYVLAPFFGLGSLEPSIMALVQYNVFPKSGHFQKLTFGVQGRSFNFFTQDEVGYSLRYSKWSPYINIHFKQKNLSSFRHWLELQASGLWREKAGFNNNGRFLGTTWERNTFLRATYKGKNDRAVHPFSYRLTYELLEFDEITGVNQYIRTSLETQNQFTFGPNQHLYFRFFVGGHLRSPGRNAGNIRPSAFNLVSQGFNDLTYQDSYFGRNEASGFWSQQITVREGGFKTPIPVGFPLGRSNDYIVAFNFKTDLPILKRSPLRLRPYFDIGYFHNATPTGEADTFQDQLLWNGGLALELLDGVLGFYFPLVSSTNLENRLAERGNFFNRISFAFDINRGDPRDRWRPY
ncbi:MAG: M1 family metallopeptidase [Saprospiraceae bacterium]|nr:M1 family metallopeptidase [Saprospiraceae bacterium]